MESKKSLLPDLELLGEAVPVWAGPFPLCLSEKQCPPIKSGWALSSSQFSDVCGFVSLRLNGKSWETVMAEG